MFKRIRKALKSFEELDKLEKDAWKADQEGRSRTAEKLLVKLTMVKIRNEFAEKAKDIAAYINLKTDDGEYENDTLTIIAPVQGKKIKDGWTAAGASYHSFLFSERSKVIDSDEAIKISRIAEEFGLEASRYGFSNPGVYEGSIVTNKCTPNATIASKVHLIITRA